MAYYKCLLCGKEFSDHRENTGGLTKVIKSHLKKEHQLTTKQYLLQVYYKGEHPKCKCGCGEEVEWCYRNALFNENHGFNKYASCTHVIHDEQSIAKGRLTTQQKFNDQEFLKAYIDKKYGLNNITNAFIDFKNNKNGTYLKNTYNIEYRTLKKYWVALGYITKVDLDKQTEYMKYFQSGLSRSIKFENKLEICPKLYNILKEYPLKYNITTLVKYYNNNYEDNILTTPVVVYNTLKEFYGEEIDELLQYGFHSKEETAFAQILRYYFKPYRLIVGKKLHFNNDYKNYYVYDYCLGNKLLIEYDGCNFYHNTDKQLTRDKEKEDFAIKHNYIFMRISDIDVKNPNLLIKIKKILETYV